MTVTRRFLVIAILVTVGGHLATPSRAQSWLDQQQAVQNLQQGVDLAMQSRGDEALPYLHRALDYCRQVHEVTCLAVSNYWIGSLHFGLRRYDQALPFLLDALEFSRAAGLPQNQLNAHFYLGTTYWAIGQRTLGMEHLEESQKLARKTGDRSTESAATMVLAQNHLFFGDYSRALSLYQAALRQAETSKLDDIRMLSHGGLATIYGSFGLFDKAIEQAELALRVARAGTDRGLEAQQLNLLAGLLLGQGQVDKALDAVEAAVELARAAGNDRAQSASLLRRGDVHKASGDLDRAVASYEEAVELDRKMPEPDAELPGLVRIGSIHLQAENYDAALAVLTAAAPVAERKEEPVLRAEILNALARAESGQGNLGVAEKHLREVLEFYAGQGVADLSDQQRLGLFQNQQQSHALMQDVLVRQDKIRDALAAAEQGRGQALRILLDERLSREDATRLGAGGITVEEIEATARRLNTTLIEYSVISSENGGDAKLFIWVISPDNGMAFRSIAFDGLSGSLSRLVGSARRSLGVRGALGTEHNRGALESAAAAGDAGSQLQRLHEILIAPIDELLPTDPSDPVILLPHAELFMVPFAALQDASGRYLIEKHTLIFAPSVKVLQQIRAQDQDLTGISKKQVLIVGDPKMPPLPPQFGDAELGQLPGTATEARRIATMFGAEVLVGEDASETKVRQRMSSARLIHLATHGLLDEFGTSIPGAIALAASKKDDGLLTATEIFEMELNADLVVLSACDTGLGRITGDGVVGLSRSLIAAGASSAVVSLWQVPDDPTAMLMINFYRNLTNGMTRAEALRHAMLATMEQHPEPYSWAAFTLIGASR